MRLLEDGENPSLCRNGVSVLNRPVRAKDAL